MAGSFENMDGTIWYNGVYVPWRDANFHLLTHSLHYGGAVFEGIRVYDGKIFKLTHHMERFLKSARILDYEIPYDLETLNAATKECLRLNNVANGYIRPIAWRGAEGMGIAGTGCQIHTAIAVWQWPSYFAADVRERGLKLMTSNLWRRPPPECSPTQSKANGLYMIGTAAKQQAERMGFDEVLLLDWRGQITETSSSNVFFIKDGVLKTAIPDCFLNGITRQSVIEIAKANGIAFEEKVVWPEELMDADEVFVTGTAVEVTPVGQIDDKTFKVGDVTKRLMNLFDAAVQQDTP